MFSEQANQFFPPSNSPVTFELPHPQGPFNESLLYTPIQSLQSNPTCYPQDIMAPASMGLFDIFQSIDPSQSLQEPNPPVNKQAYGLAVGLISPKSLNFGAAQQAKEDGVSTVSLGLNSSQLTQQARISKDTSSLSVMGVCSHELYPLTNKQVTLGFQNGSMGCSQKNNENIGHEQGMKSYPFNPHFQSNGGNSYISPPAASLQSPRLDQMSILGADITNFLDSVFEGSPATPIVTPGKAASTSPSTPHPTLNTVENVGLKSLARDTRVDGPTLDTQLERNSQTGVLRPLPNAKPATPAIGEIPATLKNEREPAGGTRPTDNILDLPRIARKPSSPPFNSCGGLGPDLVLKRKRFEEETDTQFISCRTIKSAPRLIFSGKDSQGAPTYAALITVSIPSIPDLNFSPKNLSKNLSSRRTKLPSNPPKKARLQKN
ncbi:hypothetical protein VP01_836g1 [Puccinia sorghi]|uniref:Uncharacterized protein n=1 Tax=Puccinia sorghi TaxID=27349 RepID=A0A0L6U9N6_9BASI|nr:hypothetical protein VP01_836g1 [Puccinia sorghi]